MTLEEFAQVFGVLAIQLRQTDADEATIRSYFEALKGCEVEFVQMAAVQMAQQGGALEGDSRHWFPKTSEWRALAGTIERDRTDALKAQLRKLPRPLCGACDDTGWDRSDDDRVHRCDCLKLRRLEVLGRRPWPQLPPASEPMDTSANTDRLKALVAGSVKGIR